MALPIRVWDPFRDLTATMEEMDRRMSEATGAQGGLPRRWTPTCDVIEREDEIIVTAELPGVRDEDIEITVANGVLDISGTRELSEKVSDEHFSRIERSYGSFRRRFPLPRDVRDEDVTAGIAYGVLRIRIPKPQAPVPRTVPIQSGG